MAARIAIVLEDDLDGGPADQTLQFGLGGAEYEIDLSARNVTRFRRQLAPFIEHARTAGRGQCRRPGTDRRRRSCAPARELRDGQWPEPLSHPRDAGGGGPRMTCRSTHRPSYADHDPA